MTNSQRLAQVRSALTHWIQQQSEASSEGNPIASESMLIRNGFFCGRRFELGAHRAVWFIEEDQLKIYDAEGRAVHQMSGDEISRWEAETEFTTVKMPVCEAEPPQRRAA